MKKILLPILFLLYGYIAVNAQNGYTEHNYSNFFGQAITDVDFDNSGNTWVAVARKFPVASVQAYGLYKWNGQAGTHYTKSNSALQHDAVLSLTCAGNDLWVGTISGLQKFDVNGDFSIAKDYNYLQSSGLGDKVLCLKRIKNYLWIGTDNGVGRLNLLNDKFTYYGGSLWGKAGSSVYDVEADRNNIVWLATNAGLVRLENNAATLFNKSNSGLKNNNIYSLAWKPQTNELWIGADSSSINNYDYFGLYVKRGNSIFPVEEVVDCSFKKVSATPARIQHLEVEKATGDVVVTAGYFNGFFENRQCTFFKVKGEKLIRYYIKTIQNNQERLVKGSAYFPLFVKAMPNGNFWVGVSTGKAFEVNDFNLLLNDGNNITKLQNNDFKQLDVNKVSAMMISSGDMFWDLAGQSKYEVPKSTCKSPIFAGALWMGGVDQGKDLHLAAMTYRQSGFDYFHGPIDTANISAPAEGDSNYRKIWKINRWDIEEFKKAYANGSLANGQYSPPADFISWPAHGKGNYAYNLAPFEDIDNNGKYEPMKGDFPKIKGEQALYWIFNDIGNYHSESKGLPLGAEIHAMAYAYNCDSIKDDSSNEALNYTTFYEYKIINRSTNTYDSTYFGVWTDIDLGNYSDDFVGCNPQENFAFGYNGDNDDGGATGYGKNPPMINVVLLSDKMSHFMPYSNNFSVVGNPTLTQHYYNYMRARFKNDSLLVVPVGVDKGKTTAYALSGTPYILNVWNETAAGNLKGDRRFIQSVGPYTFTPGEVKTLEYAIVYSHEPNAPNGLTTSWAKTLHDVRTVKNWYNNQTFPTCPTKPLGLSIGDVAANPLQEIKVVPNPFNNSTSLVFTLSEETKGSIEIYNMLGQVVKEIPVQQFTSGENMVYIDLKNQPNGMYLYVLRTEGVQYTGRMINVNK